jgi:selenoprotein W-related protein
LPRFKGAISRFVMVPSSGGCFELTVGDKLLYSKLKTGRFPDEGDALKALGRALGVAEEPG